MLTLKKKKTVLHFANMTHNPLLVSATTLEALLTGLHRLVPVFLKVVILSLICHKESQLCHGHLFSKAHHLPKHLFRIVSNQALLDVANVGKKVTNCCDPRST